MKEAGYAKWYLFSRIKVSFLFCFIHFHFIHFTISNFGKTRATDNARYTDAYIKYFLCFLTNICKFTLGASVQTYPIPRGVPVAVFFTFPVEKLIRGN